MINTRTAVTQESDFTEPFEDRIDILFRELELATKWQRPSLLFAVYSSEYVHSDAAIALENRLLELGQRTYHLKLKSQADADISSVISDRSDFNNVIFFVEGLRWGSGEEQENVYVLLNNRREYFIEHGVRMVFWLTENEAIDMAHYAPDYWAFRHRVIEFIDSPKPEQLSPSGLASSWQAVGELTDTNEDLDAKIALRTALLNDLPEGDESTAARANLVLTLGVLHWRRGDYDRATQSMNTALDLAAKLQDNCFEGLCFNAVALIETGLGRLEEAIQAYMRAVELAPEQISPWNNLGNLYARIGKYKEALDAYQKAIEQNPSDLASWSGLGDVYQQLGRHDDAVYAFLKTIESVPEHAQSWSGLGKAYLKEGRLDDALTAHQKALELDRTEIDSWLGLGQIFKLQGKTDNAAMAYQTALEIDPKNAVVWNELGHLYYEANSHDEALRAYRKAVELGCASQAAYSNLASIYAHKGQYAEAVPLLQKGIDLLEAAADKAQLWNRLGDAYRRLDDYNNAMAAYRKADELNSTGAAPAPEIPVEANPEPVAIENEGDGSSAPQETLPVESVEAVADALPPETPVPALAPSRYEVDFADWLSGLSAVQPVAETPQEEPPSEAKPADAFEAVLETESELAAIAAIPEPEAPAPAEPAEPSVDPLADTVPIRRKPVQAARTQPADEAGLDDTETFPEEARPVQAEPEQPETGQEPLEAESSLPPAQDPAAETTATNPAVLSQLADIARNESAGLSQSETDAKNAQIWNELGNIYYNSGAYDEAV
ncbi:MAG TPA: tetratricopeptide repeat protein, partial [Anaerolineales bacterium]|nr:tetratricopeptide repeat protein [Anaerolineales bacterium]